MTRAILLDVYGTLIDIHTDEGAPRVWEALAAVARWSGLRISPAALLERYDAALRATRSPTERHAECDVVAAFGALLADGLADGYTHRPAIEALALARLYRALTVERLAVFPDVLPAVCRWRRQGLRIGYVSDAQRAFLDVELATTGLSEAADVVIASSDHGFRKPDARLFALALDTLGVKARNAMYVGDNLARDVGGARAAGIRGMLLCRACTHSTHSLDGGPVPAVHTLAAVRLP